MDILTLKSVVSTSQGAIYCNLSILNSDSEIISTGIANFTNGNNIQIDFRDSGDDDNDDDDDDYNYDMWLPNSAEWFNISISDCTEICMIDVGEVSDSEFSSYQATPSNFMYQASFRHVDQILSEDPFDNAELSSRLISLSKLQASAFVIAKEKIKVKSVAMTNLKTEILSDLSTFTCTSFSEIGDNQLGIGENKSAANDLPGNRSKVGAIRIQFSDIEALLCALLLIVSVISGLKKVVSAVTFNGTLSHSRSCIEESLNQSNTDQLHNDEIQNTDTSSEQHQQDKVPKPSAAEEYYSMIENASESVSADYATWGHDTESESELSTINDVLNSRSRTASSDISHYKVDSVTGVPELISTDNFVPYSVSANEIGPLDSIASGCAKSASVFTSVDLVELAFLAGDQYINLRNSSSVI